jgi:hypothetical protein
MPENEYPHELDIYDEIRVAICRIGERRRKTVVIGHATDEGRRELRVRFLDEHPGMHALDPGRGTAAPKDPHRDTLEEDILGVLRAAGGPLAAKEIARLCHGKCNSHFRCLLSKLRKNKRVVHTSEGYSLPPES